MKGLGPGLAALLFFLGAGARAQIPFAKDSEALDQVREAAFRHYMHRDHSSRQENLVCLRADKELSDQFLQRLAIKSAKVVRASECTSDAFAGVHLKHPTDDEYGVLTFVESVRWISGEEAEVKGGNYWSGIGATWTTMRIAYKKGKWVIKSEVVTGVS